jgi:hypothetical protein
VIILASTSDILRVVTGAAANKISAHASWVDNNAGTITPGRTNTNITTATTTTIVGSPGASTYRALKFCAIQNNDATNACSITLQHYDGSTSVDLWAITLLPGEAMLFTNSGWRHLDANGGDYLPNLSMDFLAGTGITGPIAETVPRMMVEEISSSALTSGTLRLQAIFLRAGQKVTNISFMSGSTGATSPTHWWFALYDAARNLKASTSDQTSTAWAANTLKTVALSSPYTVPTTGLYYVGICMVASTATTLKQRTAKTSTVVAGTAPILNGTSSTGITTALPDPAAAITVDTTMLWAGLT